jgi:putative ABC transport system ATP-binding protein
MEQWLLLGSSGSGKSTLLNIISGLLRPTTGNVVINGIDIYSQKLRDLDRFRGRNIGIVFQRPHLIRSLTVKENLELAAIMAQVPRDRTHNVNLLESLGILDKSSNYPDQLSQGQLQRVSIARALVNKPDILIADEPTSSLDDIQAEKVMEMLKIQAKMNGAALIIATHDQRVKNHISKAYNL